MKFKELSSSKHSSQGSHGDEKPGKSLEFSKLFFPVLKSGIFKLKSGKM
jgi:hypothetical protein